MKNRSVRDIITLCLIVSPLWWTNGCYSSYQITSPAEAAGTPIEITTKGNNHHRLTQWSVDSSGNILVCGPIVVPLSIGSANGAIKHQQPSTFVPKDSIAAIYAQRVNEIATVKAVILTTVGVAGFAVFLFAFSFLRTIK